MNLYKGTLFSLRKTALRGGFGSHMLRGKLASIFICISLFPVWAYSKSLEELRTKARMGEALAQLQLGNLYFAERKNPTLAVYWFRKAAEQNIPQAMYQLAVCLEHGWGVPKDTKTALEYYSRLENTGMKQAAYRKAMLLWNGVFEQVEPQKKQALAALKKLSGEYAPARLALIRIFWNDPALRKTYAEELRELAEKALQETPLDPELLLFNARLNRDGIGAVGNPKRAVELTRKAVAGGSAEAKADLASYLEAGYGCSSDPKKAFELFKEAALAGVPAAQIRYGEHLLAGDYCPHDPVKGREFIQKGKSSVRKTD